MNHQSYLDPPLAGTSCDRAVYFLARRTLLDVPPLGWLLPKLNVIPVNQEGIDRSALKALIRVLNAGNAALVFPEGSRTVDGSLQPAEPGLGLVIVKTLAPVVPMRILAPMKPCHAVAAVCTLSRLLSSWENQFSLRLPI